MLLLLLLLLLLVLLLLLPIATHPYNKHDFVVTVVFAVVVATGNLPL